MIVSVLGAYCNTLRFENGSEQVYNYKRLQKVQAYVERLTVSANQAEFIETIERCRASSAVQTVAEYIGRCHESLHTLYQEQRKSIVEQDVAAHLTAHLAMDHLPAPHVIDRGHLEMVHLMRHRLWPGGDELIDVERACAEIHDAWAIQTFFKYTRGPGFVFDEDSFKKNGEWSGALVNQCVEYGNLPVQERFKDEVSWAAVAFVASHLSTVDAQAVVTAPRMHSQEVPHTLVLQAAHTPEPAPTPELPHMPEVPHTPLVLQVAAHVPVVRLVNPQDGSRAQSWWQLC